METRISVRNRTTAGAPPVLKAWELCWHVTEGTMYFGVGENAQGMATSIIKIAGAGASIAWGDLTDVPVYATRWPTFSEVTGKPTTLAGYGITDAEPKITAGTSAQYWRGNKTWATFPTTWAWANITGKPTFATVATSGAYADLSGTPSLGSLATLNDAPSDGSTYGRKNGAWAVAGGGGGTPANPSATVGLTAKNGSASTYMRSDAAPALDQSIAPTWTGQHTWSIEPRTTSSAGWRIYGGSYGVFWLLSGTNYYLMLTDSGNPLGGWNGLRPMYVDVTTGNVYFGHKASFAQFTITNRAGYTSSDYTSQGLWCSWNNTNGGGESNFVNNQGGGNGGFDFWNRTTGGTYQRLMTLGTGSSGVDSGGTTPNGKIRTGNLTASSLTLPGTTSQYVRGDGSLATMPTPLKGDKGDIGPQGPKGDTGNTGATGPQGPAGVAAGDVTYIDVRSTVPASNSANSGRLYLIY